MFPILFNKITLQNSSSLIARTVKTLMSLFARNNVLNVVSVYTKLLNSKIVLIDFHIYYIMGTVTNFDTNREKNFFFSLK